MSSDPEPQNMFLGFVQNLLYNVYTRMIHLELLNIIEQFVVVNIKLQLEDQLIDINPSHVYDFIYI